MDTSKLTVELPVDEFYNSYVTTLRKLYTDNFIASNNLQPETQNGFQRAMSKRAGISLDNRNAKAYTEKDLKAIVQNVNDKFEEYANGPYSAPVKKRGEARYCLLSTVLKQTLVSLGYDTIAAGIKHGEDSCAKDSDNVMKAYDGLVKAEEEEDKAVKKSYDALKAALTAVKSKVKQYSEKGSNLSDDDRTSIKKLMATLQDTINSAARCVTGKDDADDLRSLVSEGESCVTELQNILLKPSKEDLNRLQQKFNEGNDAEESAAVKSDDISSCEDVYATISKAATLIPGVIQELNNLKDDYRILWQQNQEYAKTLEENKKQSALPESEDELVQLAKQVIAKIEDKSKLKDIAMVIMMKAM